MRNLNILFFVTFALLAGRSAKGQDIKDGTYMGYEEINVERNPDGSLYFFPGVMFWREIQTLTDTVFLHQVTLVKKKDSINLCKIPLMVTKGKLFYSDSLGDFTLITDGFHNCVTVLIF